MEKPEIKVETRLDARFPHLFNADGNPVRQHVVVLNSGMALPVSVSVYEALVNPGRKWEGFAMTDGGQGGQIAFNKASVAAVMPLHMFLKSRGIVDIPGCVLETPALSVNRVRDLSQLSAQKRPETPEEKARREAGETEKAETARKLAEIRNRASARVSG